MYVTRNELVVSAGRYAEFEARQARLFDVMKAQPGFQAAFYLNSLGYPAK